MPNISFSPSQAVNGRRTSDAALSDITCRGLACRSCCERRGILTRLGPDNAITGPCSGCSAAIDDSPVCTACGGNCAEVLRSLRILLFEMEHERR